MDEIDHLLTKSQKVLNKKYIHFDTNPSREMAAKFISSTVLHPNAVAAYRFFPLIVYSQKRKRYHRTKGHLRANYSIKKRPISLVAHHDALVYVKYAEELNRNYEQYLAANDIFKVPTAYRKALHQSNINAAKDVFDFIAKSEDCWIIKGDFKGFFDNMRHRILQKNLVQVLAVDKLSADWRAVLKSVTRFRSVDSRDLMRAIHTLGWVRGKESPYVRSRERLGELITKGGLSIKKPNQIGIPQGTPISAVLANVYMISFDVELNRIVSALSGLYRRYSDDFVIVIPEVELPEKNLEEFITRVITTSKQSTSLEIETHKTKIFKFNARMDEKITQRNLNGNFESNKVWFDYLGFIFNGDVVRLREKGIYKFHYKSKKAINLFLRIENDREQIKNNNVPKPSQKGRVVWTSKKQVMDRLSQVPKQQKFEERIKFTQDNISYNLGATKLAAKMYLVGGRYGEYFSMLGYAKRAQSIMSNNGDNYRVEILNQIRKQIRINQQRVHAFRSGKNLNSLIKE